MSFGQEKHFHPVHSNGECDCLAQMGLYYSVFPAVLGTPLRHLLHTIHLLLPSDFHLQIYTIPAVMLCAVTKPAVD